jgi:uncharacterized protein YlzI (FlbEa/FlbD family)
MFTVIYVTRLDGSQLVVNADLIETVEHTADTVITLLDGKKLIVATHVDEVVESVIGYRQLIARGPLRLVDAPNLTTVTSAGSPLSLTSQGAGAVLNIPRLDLSSASVPKTVSVGIGGTINWGSPTTFRNGSLTVSGSGTINVQSLTNVDHSQFFASAGAVLSLPGVLTYTSDPNAMTVNFLQTAGAGAVVRMANLASMDLPGTFFAVQLAAQRGGLIDVPNLTTVTSAGSPLNLTSQGTGAVLNIPRLDVSAGAPKTVSVGIGGTINWGNPTQFHYGSLTVQGSGTINVQSLTNVDKSQFSASAGAILSLPSVSTYASDPNAMTVYFMQADGAGTVARMANLASMNLPGTFFAVQLTATNGGLVDLPNLATVTSAGAPFAVSAQGAGSTVNVPDLSSTVAILNDTFRVYNNGRINMDAFPGNMDVDFKVKFASLTGPLDIYYGDTLLTTLSASQLNAWQAIHLDLDASALLYDAATGLGFVAGGSSADVTFSDYQLTPEPATLTLLALGALAMLRHRRK